MEPLTSYLKHPELLNAETVERLWHLVDTYPYYQPARLLLMRALYLSQDGRFGPALRKAALAVPDRAKLFKLTEGEKYASQHQAPAVAPILKPTAVADANSGDRTQDLINSFLLQQTEETMPRRNRPAEASVDYMSYLMQVEEAQSETQPAPGPQTPPSNPVLQVPPSEAIVEEVASENEALPSSPFLTETLAHIYIKQGKYTKAIEIIRRLSLLNPKKNRYFADQIRFLEKLAVNQRNLEAEQEQEKATK